MERENGGPRRRGPVRRFFRWVTGRDRIDSLQQQLVDERAAAAAAAQITLQKDIGDYWHRIDQVWAFDKPEPFDGCFEKGKRLCQPFSDAS